MAVSTVQAAPNLGLASWMGSYLEKHKTMGTSFLPTATAQDFSPPQLHQYCLGQQAPRGANSGEDEEQGKSMLTVHSTASPSPSSINLLTQSPFCLSTNHHCPFLIPKVLWWKIPRKGFHTRLCMRNGSHLLKT